LSITSTRRVTAKHVRAYAGVGVYLVGGTEHCGLQLGPTLRERIELQPSP